MEFLEEKVIKKSSRKNQIIGILTYNIPHRKTYDVLCLLKVRGYKNVCIFGLPLHYKKNFKPLYEHRPQLNYEIKSIKEICENLGYMYIEIDNMYKINIEEKSKILVCGAGIIPKEIREKYIILNSHPGYIPNSRGLDALKWSIINNEVIGVTSHIIGDEIDAGYIIERKIVPVNKNDTFHALSQRVYEIEINMLVNSIEKIEEGKLIYISAENYQLHGRMPLEMEKNLLEKFENLKLNSYKSEMLNKKKDK